MRPTAITSHDALSSRFTNWLLFCSLFWPMPRSPSVWQCPILTSIYNAAISNHFCWLQLDLHRFSLSLSLRLWDREAACQPQISAARSHAHAKSPRRHHPLLRRHVPIAQIPLADVERRCSTLTSRQAELIEATELPHRSFGRRGRVGDVQLSNLGTCHCSSILDTHGNGSDILEKITGASWNYSSSGWSRFGVGGDGKARVGKVCVSCDIRQSESFTSC